jgi:hypothetical protein
LTIFSFPTVSKPSATTISFVGHGLRIVSSMQHTLRSWVVWRNYRLQDIQLKFFDKIAWDDRRAR